MATLVLPPGLQVYRPGTGGPFYDVYDAETNNAQFLCDYGGYVASPSSAEAHPIELYGANPFVWNGGTILGNIPSNLMREVWYNSAGNDFNSAGIHVRGGIQGTINRLTLGERNNLEGGMCDGIRGVQSGGLTVNNLTVWSIRDDVIETDGNNNDFVMNDVYCENIAVFFSATGSIPNAFRRVNRALIHFYRWPYRFGDFDYGLFLKTDGPSASPHFEFEDVVLAVGPTTYGDGGTRQTGGLSKSTCIGECRVLVLGGFMESATMRQAYQNAGFVVVEDGNGSAATDEYLERKAAWLGETGSGGGGGNPDPAPDAFDGNVRTRIICSASFFTPEQDTALVSWFASDDASTVIENAGAVTAWRSKLGSPIREIIQATAASQPSTGTRTNNFRNVLDSDGGDFLSGTVEIPADGNYAVHFATIIDEVTNQYQTPVCMNTAWQLEAGNGAQFNGFLRTGGADNLSLTGGPFSGLTIVSVVFNKTANTISVVVNGVERASGPYSETHAVSQALKIMCNRAQNQFFDGAVMDIIITADLTKTTQYQNYLSAKHTVV